MRTARTQNAARTSRHDNDDMIAKSLVRLLSYKCRSQSAPCGWMVGGDLWSAKELARMGIDPVQRRRLVDANLLAPLDGRQFQRGGNGAEYELTRDTLALFAFAQAAMEFRTHAAEASLAQHVDLHVPQVPAQLRPRYIIDLRELVVASVIILELPTQARTLALLLKNLEDGEWNAKVHSPLKGHHDSLEPQHLYDASCRLTHRQPLIHFHADDGGCRWQWKRLPRLLVRHLWLNGTAR